MKVPFAVAHTPLEVSQFFFQQRLTVSQSWSERKKLGETECALNFLPFLRKYLWLGLNAGGKIASVRVWLWFGGVPTLYIVCLNKINAHYYKENNAH